MAKPKLVEANPKPKRGRALPPGVHGVMRGPGEIRLEIPKDVLGLVGGDAKHQTLADLLAATIDDLAVRGRVEIELQDRRAKRAQLEQLAKELGATVKGLADV